MLTLTACDRHKTASFHPFPDCMDLHLGSAALAKWIYIYTHLYLYIYIHIVIKLKYRNKNMGLKPCYTHKSHTNSQAFSLISSPQSQVPQSPGARLGQRHGASPHQPMQHIWKSIDVHFIYIYIHTSYHISHISLYIYNYIYIKNICIYNELQ